MTNKGSMQPRKTELTNNQLAGINNDIIDKQK
jgi:hypothetical protein